MKMKIDLDQELKTLQGQAIRNLSVSWKDALKHVLQTARENPSLGVAEAIAQSTEKITEAEAEPLTLRAAALNVLLSGDDKLTPQKKLARYELARKVQDANGACDLKLTGEIDLLDKLLGEQLSIVAYGAAHHALNTVVGEESKN